MYLDKEKLRRGAAGTKLRLIGAIVLTAFFALATFWGLIDYEGLRSGLDVYAAFLALGLVLLTLSVTAHRRLGSAQAYAAAFSGSRKADLPLTELAENLRKNSATVEKELRWLLKKGYLTDCRLAMDTVPESCWTRSRIRTRTMSRWSAPIAAPASGCARGAAASASTAAAR